MNSSNFQKPDRLKLIEEMLNSEPDDAFLIYAAALEYQKAGYPEKAILLLQNLQSTDPDYLPTYYQLGKLYEALGRSAEAVRMYEAGKKIATAQSDRKTWNELSEAIALLMDEDD